MRVLNFPQYLSSSAQLRPTFLSRISAWQRLLRARGSWWNKTSSLGKPFSQSKLQRRAPGEYLRIPCLSIFLPDWHERRVCGEGKHNKQVSGMGRPESIRVQLNQGRHGATYLLFTPRPLFIFSRLCPLCESESGKVRERIEIKNSKSDLCFQRQRQSNSQANSYMWFDIFFLLFDSACQFSSCLVKKLKWGLRK